MKATAFLLALLVALLAPACQRPGGQPAGPAVLSGDAWDGPAIAYSGYREGQHPDRGDGAVNPSREEILEDLRILVDHGFRLIRMYDAGENTAATLERCKSIRLQLSL